MHGWFLLVIGTWALRLAHDPRPPAPPAPAPRFLLPALRTARWSGIGYTLFAGAVTAYLGSGEIPATGAQLAMLAWLTELLWRHARRRATAIGLLFALLGLALDLVVEFVVLGQDLGRMNTYFKVHLQVWLLLSVAAGVAGAELAAAGWPRGRGMVPAVLIAMASLLALAYLPLATYGRNQTRFAPSAPPTLDGEAFLADASYDYQGTRLRLADDQRIIAWLRRHTAPDAVILEAQLPEYRWGSRISAFTGRPTVLGYRHHESQQRPLPELRKAIELRRRNVAALYASADAQAALDLLRHYRVKYIVVGGLERAIYPAPGLEKFQAMAGRGDLETVFAHGDDRVYRVAATDTGPADEARW
jgi:uncharacterized membrane protein